MTEKKNENKKTETKRKRGRPLGSTKMTDEERKERAREQVRAWRKAHPDAMKEYNKRANEKRRKTNTSKTKIEKTEPEKKEVNENKGATEMKDEKKEINITEIVDKFNNELKTALGSVDKKIENLNSVFSEFSKKNNPAPAPEEKNNSPESKENAENKNSETLPTKTGDSKSAEEEKRKKMMNIMFNVIGLGIAAVLIYILFFAPDPQEQQQSGARQ